MLQLKTISNPDLLKIFDENSHEIGYGCNQKWYTTIWQRLSGCGPTVASNLILYLLHTRLASPGSKLNFITKRNCLSLMEEIWRYVTPTKNGVSTTKLFYEAVLAYSVSKGFNIEYEFLDFPKDRSRRPGFTDILNFLEKALLKDAPIAFLNLCNGAEKILDRWHWVTIISLEYPENENHLFVNILDDGRLKRIDLGLWCNTTTKGGGFVYFTAPSMQNVIES